MKIEGEAVYLNSAGKRHSIEGTGILSDEIEFKSLKISGTVSFDKISCGKISIEGECFGKSLTAEKISVKGTIKVDSLKSAEIFKIEGITEIDGIDGKEILIESRTGTIGEINCDEIKIFHYDDEFLSRQKNIHSKNSRVKIKKIFAEKISLENCEVDEIKCKNAFIGTNCAINELTVTGEYKISADSTVAKVIRSDV